LERTTDELVEMMKERLGGSYVVAVRVDDTDGDDVVVLYVETDGMEDWPSFSAGKLATLMGLEERDRLRGLLREAYMVLHCGIQPPDRSKRDILRLCRNIKTALEANNG